MSDLKKMMRLRQKHVPEGFSHLTEDTVCRIDENHHVIGVLYLEKNLLTMCTMNESTGQMLAARLPDFTELVRQAIGEIDVLEELVAYRIETRNVELLVAPACHCTAVVLHKRKPNKRS
ncbi:uncharacterized protein LOC134751156 [Cydia strobilella]|uniref:uncharacterized protein LOC134751156 n=1 Tax=Cydia strobilella TaxID=1100964 RepID=UPI003007E9E5